MEDLLTLLSEDVILYTDGGGKARAPLRPVYGAHKATRFLIGVLGKDPPASIELVKLNGGPAIVGYDSEGRPVGVMTLEISGTVKERCAWWPIRRSYGLFRGCREKRYGSAMNARSLILETVHLRGIPQEEVKLWHESRVSIQTTRKVP